LDLLGVEIDPQSLFLLLSAVLAFLFVYFFVGKRKKPEPEVSSQSTQSPVAVDVPAGPGSVEEKVKSVTNGVLGSGGKTRSSSLRKFALFSRSIRSTRSRRRASY